MKGVRRFLVMFGVMFGLFSLAGAFYSYPVHSATLSYGFQTHETDLVVGMAAATVQQTEQPVSFVESASIESPQSYVGIVTRVEPLAAVPASAEVFIARTGQVEVIASNLDGAIRKGDPLTLSPLKGLLTKATSSVQAVVGTAVSDLQADNAEKTEVTTRAGTNEAVDIGAVLVNLDDKTPVTGRHHSFWANLSSSLAGREISPSRIIAASLILLLLLVIEGAIIYGATRSSIAAVGRNPLARSVIMKELFAIILLAMAVMAAGVVAIYLIIRL